MTHRTQRFFRATSGTALAVALLATGCSPGDTGATTTVPASADTSVTTTAPSTTTLPSTTTTSAPTTTTTAVPEAPAGFVTVHTNDGNATIAVPERFVDVDLTDDDLAEIFDSVEADNELIQSAFDQMQTANIGVVLWAFDFTTATPEFVPNMNIIRQEAGPFDDIRIYKEVLPDMYANLGLEIEDMYELEIGEGQGLAIDALLRNGDQELAVHQLLLRDGPWSWSLTYSVHEMTPDLRMEFDSSFATFTTN